MNRAGLPLDYEIRNPLDRYSRRARIEPCACGGKIVAIPREEADAMRAHQATKEHRAWRMKEGL